MRRAVPRGVVSVAPRAPDRGPRGRGGRRGRRLRGRRGGRRRGSPAASGSAWATASASGVGVGVGVGRRLGRRGRRRGRSRRRGRASASGSASAAESAWASASAAESASGVGFGGGVGVGVGVGWASASGGFGLQPWILPFHVLDLILPPPLWLKVDAITLPSTSCACSARPRRAGRGSCPRRRAAGVEGECRRVRQAIRMRLARDADAGERPAPSTCRSSSHCTVISRVASDGIERMVIVPIRRSWSEVEPPHARPTLQ